MSRKLTRRCRRRRCCWSWSGRSRRATSEDRSPPGAEAHAGLQPACILHLRPEEAHLGILGIEEGGVGKEPERRVGIAQVEGRADREILGEGVGDGRRDRHEPHLGVSLILGAEEGVEVVEGRSHPSLGDEADAPGPRGLFSGPYPGKSGQWEVPITRGGGGIDHVLELELRREDREARGEVIALQLGDPGRIRVEPERAVRDGEVGPTPAELLRTVAGEIEAVGGESSSGDG
jgi:hypothetical protein